MFFYFLIKEGVDTWTCRKENHSPLTLGIFNPQSYRKPFFVLQACVRVKSKKKNRKNLKNADYERVERFRDLQNRPFNLDSFFKYL